MAPGREPAEHPSHAALPGQNPGNWPWSCTAASSFHMAESSPTRLPALRRHRHQPGIPPKRGDGRPDTAAGSRPASSLPAWQVGGVLRDDQQSCHCHCPTARPGHPLAHAQDREQPQPWTLWEHRGRERGHQHAGATGHTGSPHPHPRQLLLQATSQRFQLTMFTAIGSSLVLPPSHSKPAAESGI